MKKPNINDDKDTYLRDSMEEARYYAKTKGIDRGGHEIKYPGLYVIKTGFNAIERWEKKHEHTKRD